MQILEKLLIESLIECIYALVIFEYFKTFFEKKNMKGIYFYIWFISITLQIIEKYIMVDIPDYCHLITGILSLIAISNFYIGNFWTKVIFTLLYMVIGMLCELLVASVFLAYNISIEHHELVGFLASDTLLLCIVKALQRFFCNNVISNVSWTINVRLMLLPIGSMYLAYTLFSRESELGYSIGTFVCIIILLIINIIVFNMYVRLFETMELKRKNSLYEKEFDLLEQQMKEQEEVVQEFRMRKHDLKHQMTNLIRLLKSNEYEQLEYHMEEIADLRSLEGLSIVNTENSIIDAFVNYKYEIAAKEGIHFKVDLDIPVELPYAGSDLCVILGNALDNAIEANIRSKVVDAYIELKMIYDGENLIIVIDNTFDGKLIEGRGGRFTRKHDSQNHGVGIRSIQNTLKKYEGFYNVEIKDNIYHLELLLHNKEQ